MPKEEIQTEHEEHKWKCPVCDIELRRGKKKPMHALSLHHLKGCHPKEWEERITERRRLGFSSSGWTYGPDRKKGLPIMLDSIPADQRGWTCLGCKKAFIYGESGDGKTAQNYALKHIQVCQELKEKYPHIKTNGQHRAEAWKRYPEWFQRKRMPFKNTKIYEGHQMEVSKLDDTETRTIKRKIVEEGQEPTISLKKNTYIIFCAKCRATETQIRNQHQAKTGLGPGEVCKEYKIPDLTHPLKLQKTKDWRTGELIKPTPTYGQEAGKKEMEQQRTNLRRQWV